MEGMAANRFLTAGVSTGDLDPHAAAVWAATVYQAVRETGGRVAGPVIPPGPGRNYYLLRVRHADGTRLRLMLNLSVGLVAAADDADPRLLVAPFRQVPRPDLFHLAGLEAVDPADMERLLTDEHAAGLTAAERKDIAYHRPPRVGDMVFNWFG
jgi:hypothetical protein